MLTATERILAAASLTLLCLAATNLSQRSERTKSLPAPSSLSPRRRLQQSFDAPVAQMSVSSSTAKPIIYTFFHDISLAEDGGAGMTEEDNQVLLDAWKEEWTIAGWIPHVITMEDARQHPHFKTFDAMLDSLSFRTYDRMCIVRWLAMANQPGGGFMADYDTFPLSWPAGNGLPNGGRLTVHEASHTGGVPSLLSAGQEEWFRFAWAIVENSRLHQEEPHWSDMKAMQDLWLQSNQQAYVMDPNVLPAMAVLDGSGYSPENCQKAALKKAIHFSHFSVDKGVTPEGTGNANTRAQVAKNWLAGWRQNCGVPAPPQDLQQGLMTQEVVQTPPVGLEQQQQQIQVDTAMNAAPPVQSQPIDQTLSTTPIDTTGSSTTVDTNTSTESTTTPLHLLNALSPPADKPIIYTFYNEIGESTHTGMSAQDNQNLIESWARSWSEMGWDPRVLTMEVAQQHPDFGTFDAMLQGLPFGKFDRACFYRWLAMAAVQGGGWLSDYDTFPLSRVLWGGSGDPHFLPNSGSLTVHEKSKGGGVPSLVSGSAEEWFRLAKAQVENAKSHETQQHWSDMKAMQDLFQQSGGSFYLMEENVVMADAMLTRDIDRDLCNWLATKYAVHFSHFSMSNSGRFADGYEGARNRATVGRNWILQYRKTCADFANQQ